MSTLHALLCCALAALMLVGCDSTTTALRADTGLEGQVLAGPTCPVVVQDNPCPDRPFRAWFDVRDGRDRVVARFESDDDGFFQVLLPQGTYLVVPGDEAPVINPSEQGQRVMVQPEGLTWVILVFDTGIR